jgi:hypothetical protein
MVFCNSERRKKPESQPDATPAANQRQSEPIQ